MHMRDLIVFLIGFAALILAHQAKAVEADLYCYNTTTTSFQRCGNPANPVIVSPTNEPPSATAIVAVGTGSTGAVVATLAAISGVTTYICGFDVSAIGGTAAVGPITVANLVGNVSFTYELASTATGVTLSRQFTPCIPAKAADTAITVTTTADGSASAVAVNAWGFQQ